MSEKNDTTIAMLEKIKAALKGNRPSSSSPGTDEEKKAVNEYVDGAVSFVDSLMVVPVPAQEWEDDPTDNGMSCRKHNWPIGPCPCCLYPDKPPAPLAVVREKIAAVRARHDEWNESDDLLYEPFFTALDELYEVFHTLQFARIELIELNRMTEPMIAPLTKGKCVPMTGKNIKAWIVWTEEK